MLMSKKENIAYFSHFFDKNVFQVKFFPLF